MDFRHLQVVDALIPRVQLSALRCRYFGDRVAWLDAGTCRVAWCEVLWTRTSALGFLWFLDHNAFRESVRNRWTIIDSDATTWMTWMKIARRTWRDLIDEAGPVFVHVVMPQPNPHEIHVLVSKMKRRQCLRWCIHSLTMEHMERRIRSQSAGTCICTKSIPDDWRMSTTAAPPRLSMVV